jgi:hypothetical protein
MTTRIGRVVSQRPMPETLDICRGSVYVLVIAGRHAPADLPVLHRGLSVIIEGATAPAV